MQTVVNLAADTKFSLPQPGIGNRVLVISVSFFLFVLVPQLAAYIIVGDSNYFSSDLFGNLLSAGVGVFVGAVTFHFADPFGARFNFFPEKRTRMIANIISRAQEELVLSTGCLDTGVYSSDIVLEAFHSLPEGVDIIVLHRASELSDQSKKLQDFLSTRDATVLYWGNFEGLKVPTDIIIADRRHIRIELFAKNGDSNSGNKFAIYLYDNLTVPIAYFKKFIAPVVLTFKN